MPLTKFPDYYAVLNLPFGSSPDVIKKYYRELAKIYHPDNKTTGQVAKFQHLLSAYQVLSGEFREAYDKAYLKHLSLKANADKAKKEFLLPQERLIYTTSMTFLAKRGLMRTGFRRKDRAKFTGLNHDIDLIIKKEEATKRILVKIPLTVRILCPECLGSNIYCECCNGIGTYKSTRSLQIAFEPNLLVHNRVYEFELSRFRPDKFIHFKKKKLRVRIDIN